MKIGLLYVFFILSAVTILFMNASGGPAAVQGADRTMSPLSNNSSCATCHDSQAFSPTVSLQILDGEVAVTAYEPGKTYTMQVAVNGAPSAGGFGFQAVALYGEGNLNAGAFGDAPAGMQVTPLNNRMYAEHSMRSNSNTFSINWTAPASGTGDVRFYAGGNATNANNNVTGDQGASLATPVVLSEALTSNTDDQRLAFKAISIAPNPVLNGTMLTLDTDDPGWYTLSIFNAVGKRLQQQRLEIVGGKQSQWIDLRQQPAGIYFLQLSNGRQFFTQKILKQ